MLSLGIGLAWCSMVSTFWWVTLWFTLVFLLLCVTVVHFKVIECMCSLSLKALACITLLGLAVVA